MLPSLTAKRQLDATRAARASVATDARYQETVNALAIAAHESHRHRATNPGPDALASLGIRTELVPVPTQEKT